MPFSLLARSTVCCCVGAVQDITFDIALACQFTCEEVFPVGRSAQKL